MYVLAVLFFILDNKLIHSRVSVVLQSGGSPLLVIAKCHSKAIYKWEKKQLFADVWKTIEVPQYTCLLYTDTSGLYRCTVEDRVISFKVTSEYILLGICYLYMYVLTQHNRSQRCC